MQMFAGVELCHQADADCAGAVVFDMARWPVKRTFCKDLQGDDGLEVAHRGQLWVCPRLETTPMIPAVCGRETLTIQAYHGLASRPNTWAQQSGKRVCALVRYGLCNHLRAQALARTG